MDTKRKIIDRGIAGLDIDSRLVCTTSRDKRSINVRHVWPENTDARVWDRVRAAIWRRARNVVAQTGRSVEIYSAHGHMIGFITPEDRP
jgi:hypothetical protein